MAQLIDDCLKVIFTEIQDPTSLYSCILVNRSWCRIGVPILYKNPFIYKNISREKLYSIIIHFLSSSSKQFLSDNNVELNLSITSINDPLFNYISFFSQLLPYFIDDMARTLIKTGVDRFQDKRKRNLLKEEIYKLFINDCKNVKYIYWKEFPLFQYPGALTFFSQLCALGINHYFVTSRNLFEMGKICQSIKYLDVYECKGNDLGLINFIDIQKNLQSLLLYFNDIKKPCHIQFSEVIEKKAGTLKKFVLRPIIILLSPKFLLSLINLQHLELINDDNYNADESKEWQEWKKYLSISSFSNIQVLKTAFLLDPEYQGSEYDKKFIESIANYSKIEKLTIEIGAVNLDIVKNIFLNCEQLKKVNLSTSKKLPSGDELLEIITEYSSKNLCAFSFGDNWNFSVSGLRSFFENWRGRIPLKFNCYYDGMGAWTEEHIMIVKQYRDEGLIKG